MRQRQKISLDNLMFRSQKRRAGSRFLEGIWRGEGGEKRQAESVYGRKQGLNLDFLGRFENSRILILSVP